MIIEWWRSYKVGHFGKEKTKDNEGGEEGIMATMEVVAPSLGDKLLHVIKPQVRPPRTTPRSSGSDRRRCRQDCFNLFGLPHMIPCLLFTKAIPGGELVTENRN